MLEKRKRRKQSQFVEGAKMAVTPEAENEPDSLFFFFFLLLSFLTIPFHFRLSSTHFPPCTAASLRGAASRLPSLSFIPKRIYTHQTHFQFLSAYHPPYFRHAISNARFDPPFPPYFPASFFRFFYLFRTRLHHRRRCRYRRRWRWRWRCRCWCR